MLTRSRSPTGMEECALGGRVLPDASGLDAAGHAGQAAGAAARRIDDAVEAGRDARTACPRRVSTSMIWPSPPRYSPAPPESVRYSLLPHQHRRNGLGDLDRNVAHAAGEGAWREARRAWAVRRCRRNGSEVTLKGVAFISLSGVAVDAAHAAHQPHVPQARRALGRHAVGQRLLQAAEHDVGQHLADDRCAPATGAGCLAFRMQPSGAVTRMVASEAALLGTCGATMHLTPKLV